MSCFFFSFLFLSDLLIVDFFKDSIIIEDNNIIFDYSVSEERDWLFSISEIEINDESLISENKTLNMTDQNTDIPLEFSNDQSNNNLNKNNSINIDIQNLRDQSLREVANQSVVDQNDATNITIDQILKDVAKKEVATQNIVDHKDTTNMTIDQILEEVTKKEVETQNVVDQNKYTTNVNSEFLTQINNSRPRPFQTFHSSMPMSNISSQLYQSQGSYNQIPSLGDDVVLTPDINFGAVEEYINNKYGKSSGNDLYDDSFNNRYDDSYNEDESPYANCSDFDFDFKSDEDLKSKSDSCEEDNANKDTMMGNLIKKNFNKK